MSALHEPVNHEPGTNGSEMVALFGALTTLEQGRTGVRLPADWTGVAGKVADAFNEVVELNERMAEELARLSRVVGKEGQLKQPQPQRYPKQASEEPKKAPMPGENYASNALGPAAGALLGLAGVESLLRHKVDPKNIQALGRETVLRDRLLPGLGGIAGAASGAAISDAVKGPQEPAESNQAPIILNFAPQTPLGLLPAAYTS